MGRPTNPFDLFNLCNVTFFLDKGVNWSTQNSFNLLYNLLNPPTYMD